MEIRTETKLGLIKTLNFVSQLSEYRRLKDFIFQQLFRFMEQTKSRSLKTGRKRFSHAVQNKLFLISIFWTIYKFIHRRT